MQVSGFHFQIQILFLLSKNSGLLDHQGIKEKLAPSLNEVSIVAPLDELLTWGWIKTENGFFKVSNIAYQIMGGICNANG